MNIDWSSFCSTHAMPPQASRLVRLAVLLVTAFSASGSLYLLTQPSVMAIVCQPAGFDCAPEALRATAWRVWVGMSCEYVLACLVCIACMALASQLLPLRHIQRSPRDTGRHMQPPAGDQAKSGPSATHMQPSASAERHMQQPSNDEQPTEASCTSCSMVGTAGQSSSLDAEEQLHCHGEATGQVDASPACPAARGSHSVASTACEPPHIGCPQAPQLLDSRPAPAPPDASSITHSASQPTMSHADEPMAQPAHSQLQPPAPEPVAPNSLSVSGVDPNSGNRTLSTAAANRAGHRASSMAAGLESEGVWSHPCGHTHDHLSTPASPGHQDVAPTVVMATPVLPAPVAPPTPIPFMTIDLGQLLQEAAAARARGVVPSPLYTSPIHGAAFVSSKVCIMPLSSDCLFAWLLMVVITLVNELNEMWSVHHTGSHCLYCQHLRRTTHNDSRMYHAGMV